MHFGLQGRIIKLHFGDLGLTLKKVFLFCMCIIPCKLPNLVSLQGQKSKKIKYMRIQCRMQNFEKISQSALNHVLILQKYRTQKMLQIPLKIIDLQNDVNIFVARQWKIKISVPMSYISLFENLAVLEKSWAGATH